MLAYCRGDTLLGSEPEAKMLHSVVVIALQCYSVRGYSQQSRQPIVNNRTSEDRAFRHDWQITCLRKILNAVGFYSEEVIVHLPLGHERTWSLWLPQLRRPDAAPSMLRLYSLNLISGAGKIIKNKFGLRFVMDSIYPAKSLPNFWSKKKPEIYR